MCFSLIYKRLMDIIEKCSVFDFITVSSNDDGAKLIKGFGRARTLSNNLPAVV